MTGPLLVLAVLAALIAALAHVGFFALESVLWSRPRVWRLFGVRSQQDADTMRFLAYNQGFYNAFLALGAGAGVVLILSGVAVEAGIALTLFALLAMTLAAVVLVTGDPRLWRGALIQGSVPAVGAALIVAHLLVG